MGYYSQLENIGPSQNIISITREIKVKLSMKSENDTIIAICEVREVSMRSGTRP